MTTPRKIRNLKAKIEQLEEQLGEMLSLKRESPKLRRQLKMAEHELEFAIKMEEIRIKSEHSVEEFRLKQEIKAVTKIAVIEREEQKINRLVTGYSETRQAKEAEKIERQNKQQAEESLRQLEKSDPLMAKALRLIQVDPSLSMTEALALVTKKEEDQIADDGTLQELIQQNQQELREESRIQELPIKAIDDGLEFLDSAIAPPEKSFAARLAEGKK
jgi:hypothetical protein